MEKIKRAIIIFLLLIAVLSFIACSEGEGIASNNYGPSTNYGLAPTYDELFSLSTIRTIHIHITEAEWNGLLNDFDVNYRNEVYRKADFYYCDDTNTTFKLNNVGFRIRGNTSRRRPEVGTGLHVADAQLKRAHFKIKFNAQFDSDESCYGAPSVNVPTIAANSGREMIPNIRGLNLKYNKKDPSYIREVFNYDLLRRFGLKCPRATFIKLYIRIGDEDSKYMGVFTMFENIDKTWVRRHYGVSSYLFKCLNTDKGPADLNDQDTDGNSLTGKIGIEVSDPSDGNWVAVGSSRYRPPYDLKAKTDEFIVAQNKLNELIALLQGSPSKTDLEGLFDVDSFLKTQAIDASVGMWDDYWRNGNNYYLVYRPTDLKWMLIPYDYDNTLGGTTYVGDLAATSSLTNWGGSGLITPLLVDKIMAIPAFFTSYTNYLGMVYNNTNDYFSWDSVQAKMLALQAVISPHVTGYDSDDPYPYSGDLNDIESFVNSRITRANLELLH